MFAPKLALDHRFPIGFRLGANSGLLLRQPTTFENVEAGSEFTYSAAAEIHLGGYDRRVALGADVHGGAGLSELNFEELPLEGQLYTAIDVSPTVLFQAGPAFGIVPGYGSPTLRVFAGLRWTPTAHDADHDGIADDVDKCPDKAEDRKRHRGPGRLSRLRPDGARLPPQWSRSGTRTASR